MKCFFHVSCAVLASALGSYTVIASAVAGQGAYSPHGGVRGERGTPMQNRDFQGVNDAHELQSRNVQAAGQQKDVTCELATAPAAEKPETTIAIDEYTLKATFICGGSDVALVPACTDQGSAKCCDVPTCEDSNAKPIKNVLVDADGTVTQAADTKKFTVALDRMPARDKKMYYKCKGSAAAVGKECLVTVKMPQEPPSGTCTLNRTIALQITSAKQSVEFVCNTPGTLEPEVYTTEACAGEKKKLEAALPGAQLGKASNGKYTLTAGDLPSQATKVCLKCNFPAPEIAPAPSAKTQTTVPCNVIVSVSASGDKGSSTTTASTTSDAVGSNPGVVLASVLVAVTVTKGM